LRKVPGEGNTARGLGNQICGAVDGGYAGHAPDAGNRERIPFRFAVIVEDRKGESIGAAEPGFGKVCAWQGSQIEYGGSCCWCDCWRWC